MLVREQFTEQFREFVCNFNQSYKCIESMIVSFLN